MPKQYLLDTNICVHYLNGKYNLNHKIDSVGLSNCYISEITVAELIFGAENSGKIAENRKRVNDFQSQIAIIPIFNCLDCYGREKVRLRKQGTPVDEFDLLIGVTAVVNELIMVTNNVKHFEKIQNIAIEDWTS
jgi:tRNA(fMet)-specific endonuclease VapC